jgi:hydrogenase maturation protease
MLEEAKQPKIVIVGLGNVLLQDEGVGIHLVRSLGKGDLGYTNVEIIDGGTSSDIVSLVEGADTLIIIDAVRGGDKPGTIYRFGIDDVNSHLATRLSVHQLDIVDNLRLLELLGRGPRSTVIIGIEPETVDWGLELSWEVQNKMAKIASLVKEEIEETG